MASATAVSVLLQLALMASRITWRLALIVVVQTALTAMEKLALLILNARAASATPASISVLLQPARMASKTVVRLVSTAGLGVPKPVTLRNALLILNARAASATPPPISVLLQPAQMASKTAVSQPSTAEATAQTNVWMGRAAPTTEIAVVAYANQKFAQDYVRKLAVLHVLHATQVLANA
jgi:hypothetical protein